MTPFARKRAILYLAKLRRLVNGWVAAAISVMPAARRCPPYANSTSAH
jgi:hypothetical protein